jgi:hypothetical protein
MLTADHKRGIAMSATPLRRPWTATARDIAFAVITLAMAGYTIVCSISQ